MSWASIAMTQPKAPADSSSVALTAKDGLKLLVVDANAIIDGVRLEGIADRAVTIQEVLDEIRDKQSRQYLAKLPYELEVAEPSEDSIKAVTRFARATGDVAALSTVDIKLLALVHTMEAAAYGDGHLSAHPHQPRMHTKASFVSEELPGWGSVPNPEDWTAVDAANDADEAALLAASTSRIVQHVQQLTLDPTAPNPFLQDPAGSPDAASAGPPAPLTPGAVGGAAEAGTCPAFAAPAAAAGTAAAKAAAVGQQQQRSGAEGSTAAAAASADAGAGGADGWEVAASSKGAARHRKRKEVKRQQHQQAFEQEWTEHSELVQQQEQQPQQEELQQSAPEQQPEPEQQHTNGAAGQDADGRGAEDASNDELLAEEHCVYTADEVSSASNHQQQQAHGPGSPGWQSGVAIITGDFAMQNVLLQMGLRLITKDGRRIARLTRYALRCSACFTVTREPGRLFCPKCGNLSLDRVEVVVGADGAEYFGVTKRHILRGTRYSLPKPKGGRTADNLVLREDVFLQKVKALGKQAIKKKAADAEEAAVAAGVDPFAPEYSQDTWHVASQQELAQHRGLAAVLQPAWKQNPNERKLTRSNRRG